MNSDTFVFGVGLILFVLIITMIFVYNVGYHIGKCKCPEKLTDYSTLHNFTRRNIPYSQKNNEAALRSLYNLENVQGVSEVHL